MIKKLAIACLLFLFVLPTQSAEVRTLLECKGYSLRLKGPITHEVAIDGATGEVDGQPYHVSQSATQFKLNGPIPKNDRVFSIDRVTGEWESETASVQRSIDIDYSVEGSEGCRKVEQKF
jgi:hypothetical protein